ncbi:MAG: DUF58 domain-containing protein [Vicinamibacterales bacterium]
MTRSHVTRPAELSALRDLELATRATVEGLRQGLHRSPFHGYSAEFSQYRHYRPGDDLKYVDWKAFGRTDRLFTRQFRETTNLSALFVVDVSHSMAYGEKFRLAQAAAAVLATLVIDQGDQAGLVAVGGEDDAGSRARSVYVRPGSGHRQLPMILGAIAQLSAAGRESLPGGLQRAASLMRRRGVVVAISDFYEDDEARAWMRRLARMGHEVIAIQTLDAGEIALPSFGMAELVDLESTRTIVVQSDAARAAYGLRVANWLVAFETAVRREGIDYLRLVSGEPLERALRRFLIARRGTA